MGRPKKLSLSPTPGHILLQAAQVKAQTKSGIYLPETAEEKPQEGIVLAVGAPIYESEQEILPPCKAGDRVIYKKWGGNEVKVDDQEYLFVKFDDILAIFN